MGEGVPGYADYTANVPFRLLPGVSWRPAALPNNSMEPLRFAPGIFDRPGQPGVCFGAIPALAAGRLPTGVLRESRGR
ncbi:MAG: hypothetical protein HW409_579 [candidate division NC10 bacterium]|nr:hypothetical protein [candidate division NC10 bacterium]